MRSVTTWVATFNGAEARFYDWRRADKALLPLDLGIEAGDHRPAHSDRPVRTYASAGTARGTGDPETDAERGLEQAFVEGVSQALDRSLLRFDRLVIAASPRALGAFRGAASPSVLGKVWHEIGHDYVHTPLPELVHRLHEHCP
jgi:protein required for attachment to host cells